ncbi:guanine nucleotide-binding protein G(I)/G(S)/G(O) subunit gamma-10 isoform X1 [Lemur catta]|uniref:guanine nucleotide-binding protein G(I)/G(S)/G(O) subunit gamma-10 isoform X1 n=1 Tax=Lemur catta TaxID=9447 RepID=UPI001E269493|nr:guanine nucleotide-binding protein G(I)/G(S)/G(O) subunit gamma-10 isoform X1 [Lemur catta]XP_045419588.1 guanine nucleotide-binding protein G(I)/G(S)/G(O) subunit gamma-10 isoform X1 [Lemur catta]
MSSGASASALQRLVEQLKLEAGVERIKAGVHSVPLLQGSWETVSFHLPCVQFTCSSDAKIESMNVSQAAAELQQYCMQNACKDALLVGVPAGSNPFREPRSCALL